MPGVVLLIPLVTDSRVEEELKVAEVLWVVLDSLVVTRSRLVLSSSCCICKNSCTSSSVTIPLAMASSLGISSPVSGSVIRMTTDST